MKRIHLIFFFICLIPTIFNSSDDEYSIIVRSEINTPQCYTQSPFVYVLFSFYATVNGISESDRFIIYLKEPNYVSAECSATISPQDSGLDTINCFINTVHFPSDTYILPSDLKSAYLAGTNYVITIENWANLIGAKPTIVNPSCYVKYAGSFIRNKDVPVNVLIDDYGYRHLYATGSFDYSNANQNYLTSSDPVDCVIQSYLYVDQKFNYYECDIYIPDETVNSGDYTMECIIKDGKKTALFFPTFSLSTDNEYIYSDIYGEVDLSGTFAKLSGLLLLSLLLF
jgi:hypothetical protein